jgi:transcriptional regulator with XRE-family HTH domain
MVEVTDFCKLIKDMRAEKGLTVRELSSLTGIDISNLSQIENGKQPNVGHRMLMKILTALEVRIYSYGDPHPGLVTKTKSGELRVYDQNGNYLPIDKFKNGDKVTFRQFGDELIITKKV